MSAWVRCEICGKQKEVPAFEGDGVYSEHTCSPEKHNAPYELDKWAHDLDMEDQ